MPETLVDALVRPRDFFARSEPRVRSGAAVVASSLRPVATADVHLSQFGTPLPDRVLALGPALIAALVPAVGLAGWLV